MAYQSRQITWIAGQVLYAADLNLEFDAILATLIPEPSGVKQGDILYRGASTWDRLGVGTGLQVLRTNVGATAPEWASIGTWTLIPAANYTATPASTSTLTMGEDMTATVLVGMGLRYTIGAVEYFGRVAAIADNLLTANGAPLSGSVSNLQFGGTVSQLSYSNADSVSVVTTGTKYTLRWNKQKSYMVFYQVKMIGHDTHATEAKLTWKINATEVNTVAGGLDISANDTWYSTVVDIATAAYDVNYGEDITLVATEGGNVDGYGIVANAIIITP